MKYKGVNGTQDFLPERSSRLRHIEDQLFGLAQIYNYKESRTPIFEYTELFSRGIGTETDIVSKEMYTFTDSGDKKLTLRPENTASMVRMINEHNYLREHPQTKLFYSGPMFRRERPQKGRFRQFHQYGFEAIGPKSPELDAEMIILAVHVLASFELSGLKVEINSIGDKKSREKYVKALKGYVKPKLDQYCNDCKKRYDTNPLRILDCKLDMQLNKAAPKIIDSLSEESRDYFDHVVKLLDSNNVDYTINHLLVRGLDYYSDTVFEISSSQLGSQSALLGGGRYDYLFEDLGAKHTPAIGFAGGFERLMMALEESNYSFPDDQLDLFIVTMDENSRAKAQEVIHRMRKAGFSVDTDYLNRSVKAQMKFANKLNSRFSFVLGESELSSKQVKLKEMESGEVEVVDINRLEDFLKK